MTRLLLAVLLAVPAAPVAAEQPRPTYLAPDADLNAFTLFADGGFDGNWYVGYNNCWIVRLPKIPRGNWKSAYIGAKLGRAKTSPDDEKPWLRKTAEGKIHIGVNAKAQWTPRSSFVLTDTEDIPTEPVANISVDGVGAGRWFWVEVPLGRINSRGDNWIALWSPTNDFTSRTTAPIVAAMRARDAENGVWLNRSIKGIPPRDEASSLETPVLNLVPAVAIKLVPQNGGAVVVHKLRLDATQNSAVAQLSASGTDLRLAWIESSEDKIDWKRITPFVPAPPFTFTIDPERISKNGTYIRGAASDDLENVGFSEPTFLSFKSN